MLVRYFGTAASPDYSATLAILARDPYREVRQQLASYWPVVDLTDPNSDLGFAYALEGHDELPTVRLSVVGPFATITDVRGGDAFDDTLESLLSAAGFAMLRRQVLEIPVTFWEPEATGCIYEFLFEFDQGLPWRR